jgi:hypothetical protein
MPPSNTHPYPSPYYDYTPQFYLLEPEESMGLIWKCYQDEYLPLWRQTGIRFDTLMCDEALRQRTRSWQEEEDEYVNQHLFDDIAEEDRGLYESAWRLRHACVDGTLQQSRFFHLCQREVDLRREFGLTRMDDDEDRQSVEKVNQWLDTCKKRDTFINKEMWANVSDSDRERMEKAYTLIQGGYILIRKESEAVAYMEKRAVKAQRSHHDKQDKNRSWRRREGRFRQHQKRRERGEQVAEYWDEWEMDDGDYE